MFCNEDNSIKVRIRINEYIDTWLSGDVASMKANGFKREKCECFASIIYIQRMNFMSELTSL